MKKVELECVKCGENMKALVSDDYYTSAQGNFKCPDCRLKDSKDSAELLLSAIFTPEQLSGKVK